MKVLFVCRGNVARSMMAEMLLKEKAPLLFTASSADTKLSGHEQPLGELTPALNEVIAVMHEIGIDVTQNIRRNVTESMVTNADKVILVVDEHDPIPEYLFNNPKVTRWDVLDPKGKDLECTRNVRNQISDLVDKFIEENK